MARISLLVTLCLVLSGIGQNAEAVFCPLCQAVSATLNERISQSDSVVLVSLVSIRKPTEKIAGQTILQVTKVVKSAEGTVRKGDRITLSRYYPGKLGEQFLLLGTRVVVLEWGVPIPVTKASFEYITQAPSSKESKVQRLAYFLKFLEHSDPTIANDAYAEFAVAPYKDVRALRKQIPRQKVHRWISEGQLSSPRMSLYGLLLGFSGNDEDAELLKKKIMEPGNEFRLGIDGVIGGYLLLKGEEALKFLEEKKLKNKDALISDTFAVMKGLRFLWKFEPDRIPKERLKQSLRILLKRPELADLVIADLSRWEDWSIQDRLMAMYDEKEYGNRAVKGAIIRYMLTCSRGFDDKTGAPPKHVVQARNNLQTLRKKDPKTVKNTERFYLTK